MRWVIVGSTGYIGSALCRYLVSEGYPVLSVSRQSRGPYIEAVNTASHHQVKDYEPRQQLVDTVWTQLSESNALSSMRSGGALDDGNVRHLPVYAGGRRVQRITGEMPEV